MKALVARQQPVRRLGSRLVAQTALAALTLAHPATAQESAPVEIRTAEIADTVATPSPFDEAWLFVQQQFVHKDLNHVDWDAARARHKPAYDAAESDEQRSAAINALLEELHTSHTHHYIPSQPEYYELLQVYGSRMIDQWKLVPRSVRDQTRERPGSTQDVDWPWSVRAIPGSAGKSPLRRYVREDGNPFESVTCVGIGIRTVSIDGKTFIRNVFDDSPAEQAGLHVGDELLSADGR